MADTQGFAGLSRGQKIVVVLVLMTVLFVIWEMIGLYHGGKNASTFLSPSQPAVAATVPTPKVAVQPSNPPNPVAAPSRVPVAQVKPEQSRPEAQMVPPASILLTQQEQVQSKYVSALNELQMLKIQKEIAETSQAIVAAKLATVAAEKSITNILSEADLGKNPPPKSEPVVPLSEAGGYSVQSVSMEQDQWHALVKFKDKLYSVTVGDMLPPDRSLVKAIDQKGVILDTGGLEQRIPLTVSDTVNPTAPSPEPALPLAPPPGVH